MSILMIINLLPVDILLTDFQHCEFLEAIASLVVTLSVTALTPAHVTALTPAHVTKFNFTITVTGYIQVLANTI